ncbi:hypothetical protein [Streptomyces prunicolor]|uniref:hypothetical protein n=1 Tax=Streptomyces prunicolor TaxID=67348 RepID=UPI0033E0772A
MNHTHMAVGSVRDGLANVAVVVSWTPGEQEFGIKVYKNDQPIEEGVWSTWSSEPFEITPSAHKLDRRVYFALAHSHDFPSSFVRGLAGFGFFAWDSPANMTREARAMYGAAR